MIENPAEKKVKQSAREVLRLKHEATLARKELSKKVGANIRKYNQSALEAAKQAYKANPAKKNYRVWQTAVTRASK